MDHGAGPACVVSSDSLTGYDFGPSHPMAPIRVGLAMELAGELGVVGADLVEVPAVPADDDLIATVHTPDYIAAVKAASDDPTVSNLAVGLGTDDNPTFAHMHAASSLIVGASVEAARQVWTGGRLRAINVCGGLHHAMPDRASGFCIYNDVAVAIRWLLDHGAHRVAYVDVDAHHGDGVQKVFYDDPRVLTISLHETPQTLFPGTGLASETGTGDAVGTSVNVALPPGTSDAGWLRAYHAVVPALVREFKPDVLVTQQGCDSHMDDPLTNLMLSVDGQRASYLALRGLADEVCGGRWVAYGGGGYAVTDVVPRSWAHLMAIVGGHEIDPTTPTPPQWRAHVSELKSGGAAPLRMTDGRTPSFRDWREGYDPASWLDRQILATRNALFPAYGLDPMP
ncbi:acetoin utilization protein AcuC [Mumia sp. Pv 4-285]|uniref:acetoin utilization protein AcuC n=1 Tax=Mumia qirimensis TaxID=3234852 RepID=UPI00351D3C7B